MNLYIRLLSYVKPYWKSTVVTLIAMLVVSVGNLVPTWIAGRIVIDGVIVQRDVSRLHWIALPAAWRLSRKEHWGNVGRMAVPRNR